MCGLIYARGMKRDVALKMLDAIAHRGVRSHLKEVEGGWLGHARLPVQGLDERYDQPYPTEEGGTMAFVGELYDFREVVPHAVCDATVVADLWAEAGTRLLATRDWMGHLVVVEDDGTTHAVTDFLSKRPLYLHEPTGSLASEIKALVLLEGGTLRPDPFYFSCVEKWGYHAGARTPFRNVRRLGPGVHRVDPLACGSDESVYTRLEPEPRVNVREAVERAVRRRLVSDVPVSVLASGGLDSTIVLGLVRRAGADVAVVHVDNDEAEYLEDLWGLEVTRVTLDDVSVDRALHHNEGPSDLGSMLPQLAMSNAVADQVGTRVMLTGDGADELFGGYRRALEYDSQQSDVFEELVSYHLPRLDKLSAARTLELRSPFLAREVVEGALAWPWNMRRGKNGLKAAFADVVPSRIRNRPKRPLKSPQVLEGGLTWVRELSVYFRHVVMPRYLGERR